MTTGRINQVTTLELCLGARRHPSQIVSACPRGRRGRFSFFRSPISLTLVESDPPSQPRAHLRGDQDHLKAFDDDQRRELFFAPCTPISHISSKILPSRRTGVTAFSGGCPSRSPVKPRRRPVDSRRRAFKWLDAPSGLAIGKQSTIPQYPRGVHRLQAKAAIRRKGPQTFKPPIAPLRPLAKSEPPL